MKHLRTGGQAAVAATAVLALSGAGVAVTQAPASAAGFSQTFTCNVPVAGTRTVTATGSLTASPGSATSGSASTFALHISSLSLSSPVSISSWSGTAEITGRGAENSSFTVSGSGGSIPAGSNLSDADLTGSWTPSKTGSDSFTVGDVTIQADAGFFGTHTVTCTPSGTAPTAETLSIRK